MIQAIGTGITIGLGELIQFVTIAFASGGLTMAVRYNGKRISVLETQRETDRKDHDEAMQRVEAHSTEAIERLGGSIQELSKQLAVVVETHELRLTSLEKQDR